MRILIFLLLSSVTLIKVHSNVIPEAETEVEKSHPYGKPMNLMKFDDEENIIIDAETLDNTFLHPEVKDRKIVAVSIVGAFRKGKSFLMDYALRYMYAHYKSIAYPENPLSNKRDWVGDVDAPLKGFTWRGGTSRDTTGVVLWSDVFIHDHINTKTKKVEKIAIVLMDTQGLFDTKTTQNDNSRIFALGTLTSSILIFNLNDVIQENQLEYLQMATDFAKFAMEKKGKLKEYKPFQNLLFLMRDWSNDEEFNYGYSGGSNYLRGVLNIDSTQPQELQNVRRFISESFEQSLCFLLPHPGKEAVNNKKYDGRFSMLSEDFQFYLKELLNLLLDSKNLKKKKILNQEVTGSQYLQYLKMYFEVFQSNDIPKVETILGITVKKQYDLIIIEAMNHYKNNLNTIEFKIDEQWKEINSLEQEIKQTHDTALEKAVQLFRVKKKLGSSADERKYEAELKNQIAIAFNDWKIKIIDTYQKIKAVEEQKAKELEELNRRKEEELEAERQKAEEERLRLQHEHNRTRTELEGTIEDVKNKTAQEIKEMTEAFNQAKEDAERHKQEFLNQLEEEKRQIEEKAQKTENDFQMKLATLQEEIRKKEELARQQVEDKKAEALEALRLQAEERKIQFEREMKIAENREKALAEQRKFEQEQMREERRIREQAAREERQEREKAEREQKAADGGFQQKLEEARREAAKEEREARERKDKEWQQMMMTLNKPQPPPNNHGNTNLLLCFLTLFIAC